MKYIIYVYIMYTLCNITYVCVMLIYKFYPTLCLLILFHYYFVCIIDIILFLTVILTEFVIVRALVLLIFKFMTIHMQSCIGMCIGSAATFWRYEMRVRYSEYLPGSGLYVDFRPGWSTTAEHKRRSITGSAAPSKGTDSPRWCGTTSCRRMNCQSRSWSALESTSTCWKRARVRRCDGSWRWHNLKEKISHIQRCCVKLEWLVKGYSKYFICV